MTVNRNTNVSDPHAVSEPHEWAAYDAFTPRIKMLIASAPGNYSAVQIYQFAYSQGLTEERLAQIMISTWMRDFPGWRPDFK